MPEKSRDTSAPHWVVFITNEHGEDRKLILEAFFAGHAAEPVLFYLS
jgi:hypothetical protein